MLFKRDRIKETNRTSDMDNLSIDYFIFGVYIDRHISNIFVYIYDENKKQFNDPTNAEYDYICLLDFYYKFQTSDDLCVLSLDYNDWKKNIQSVRKAFLQINENITIIPQKYPL